MKILFLLLTLIFSFVKIEAQSLKDFYIPKNPYNKSTFITPSQPINTGKVSRIIYYVNKESAYEVTEAQVVDGSTSSILTNTVEFSTNELRMTKSVLTNPFETNKQINYSSPRVVLKMPEFGKTASWFYTDPTGDKIKCTSEWTAVTFSDGIENKVLKVVESIEGLSSKKIMLYMNGIGLWKTQIQSSNGETITVDNWYKSEEDSSINAKEKEKEESEIKSKIYDLKEFDITKYQSFVSELRSSLIEKLKSNSSFPDFSNIEGKKEKYFKSKNTYSAYYRLVDRSRKTIVTKDYVIAGSNDIRIEHKFTLVDGEDRSCKFLENSSPSLPTIEYKGYTVMTEANVENITVDYTKGLTNLKIRDGIVIYNKYLPPTDIQSLLSKKLKTEPNGIYQVKYEVGQVMGDSFVVAEKSKLKSTGGKILKTAGAILLVGGVLLFL